MIGNPKWFNPRKYTGWGLTPNCWQGWAYIFGFLLPIAIINSISINQSIKEYTISSGKWGRTPTGVFKIWTKIRSQKMEGGSKLTKDYYYLPNVPYIMFFYNNDYPKRVGFSLHGTYWHNNFGVPMSHGCINMKTADAAEVFHWAEIGTEVRIYGKYQYKKTAMK